MRRVIVISIALIVAILVAIGWSPLRLWWGSRSPGAEAERLVSLAGVRAGASVAEIGAGGGEMARVMARAVLPAGRMYVTELDDSLLEHLHRMVDEEKWQHVEVRRGEEMGTSLPDRCCDLIYMRHVFHHFGDRQVMAAALRRAVKPEGNLAVIDFERQWFLGLLAPVDGGHGIAANELIEIVTAAGFELQHYEPDWTSASFLAMFH